MGLRAAHSVNALQHMPEPRALSRVSYELGHSRTGGVGTGHKGQVGAASDQNSNLLLIVTYLQEQESHRVGISQHWKVAGLLSIVALLLGKG